MTNNSSTRPDRSEAIVAFLDRIGWNKAERNFLAGDASFRRYERISHEGNIRVLMDAPPPWEDVRPFIAITEFLRGLSLNAPRIDAADEAQGFLLLEDLGDASFSKVLAQDNSLESTLYHAAIDALIALQSQCKPMPRDISIAAYDEAIYLREVALFSDWFLPQIMGIEAAKALQKKFSLLWQAILSKASLQQSVLVHRDYHADNLLWLPERLHVQRVGMLDYQDALWGDPFYDVISLLEDARRDVSDQVRANCVAHFIEQAQQTDSEAAMLRYHVLAAQRNMKIVGIFTRLSVRDGKTHYLNYLPRVWTHLMRDLTHPALLELHDFVEQHVPVSARKVIPINTTIESLSCL